jgi:hypothetical protein
MSTKTDYLGVMMEEMNGKFDLLLELFDVMNRRMDTFATNDRLDSMIRQHDIANAAIKKSMAILDRHERRTTALEQK